ncbi:hypothetical protein F7R91_41605 [Streptomyces luteolifulvus]|uniref:Roadblock/LAMTOR2 domain-containing protein n=1 Tax=Streptomyces luteolifulvus TaxID=2615112 RepID=A0A6H9UML3_9ACTN|nr:hypothetical protein [Streptomyces luteolifulvus]KAB1138909.1 hypothetical protein F7R91_41605 [Streptomyces luteolifulvus]
MSAIQVALNRAMRLDGALGVAVVDYVSRMALGTVSRRNDLDLERAAHGGTDVVRAHLSALDLIGHKPEQLEDVLITLDSEYHLIRPLTRRTHEGLFILVVLDRERAAPDGARQELQRIEDLL